MAKMGAISAIFRRVHQIQTGKIEVLCMCTQKGRDVSVAHLHVHLKWRPLVSGNGCIVTKVQVLLSDSTAHLFSQCLLQ